MLTNYLGQILGVPRKDAQSYIERYFAYYAGVRQWLDRTIADAHAAMRAGTLTCRALVDAYLRRGTDAGLVEAQRKAMNTGSDPDGGYLVLPEMDKQIDRIAERAGGEGGD